MGLKIDRKWKVGLAWPGGRPKKAVGRGTVPLERMDLQRLQPE